MLGGRTFYPSETISDDASAHEPLNHAASAPDRPLSTHAVALVTGRLPLAGAAAVVVVLALFAAAARAPGVVRAGYDSVRAPGQSATQRELAPFGSEIAGLIVAAAKAIPGAATYTIVFGDAPPVSIDAEGGAASTFQYWLLPRRYTPDLASAEWVIAYHHASETVGVRYREEIPLGPYVNAFKVIR